MAILGLFFGIIPTSIAVIFLIAYKLYLGGIVAYVDICMIATYGIIGIIWRKRYLENIITKGLKYSCINLYILGLIVHTYMFLLIVLLGLPEIEILKQIAIPVIVLYPIGNIYIGLFIRMQIIRQRKHDDLIKNERKYKTFAAEMKQGLAVYEIIYNNHRKALDCVFLEVNRSFEKLIGLNRENIIGKPITKIIPESEYFLIEKFTSIAVVNQLLQCEYYFNAISRRFEMIVYPIEENKYSLMILEITESIEQQKKNDNLYSHDKLTGLYSREFFEKRFLKMDVKRNLPITIIISDVDDFKIFNDAFGHKAGDKLLKKIASIINDISREKDIVSRVSGDRFAFVLPKTDSNIAREIIERIDKQLMQVNNIEVTVSSGIATKNTENGNIMEFFREAENDMEKNKLLKKSNHKGNIIFAIMSTLNIKNSREKEHSERVSELCEKMGKTLKFKKNELNELKITALLHDIGKITLDESLLNKPDKLSDEEWKQMKTHPDAGFKILNSVDSLKSIARNIRFHHEKWDGKGYPKGLTGEEIPYFSRIVALADSYDAMISKRTYKEQMTQEEAIEEIVNNKGIQFDPDLVDIFINQVTQ